MRKKLLDLLSSGEFVSGESLAKKLHVSRAAVWKQVKVLIDIGYEIESVKNKGYRLLSRPDIPVFEEVTRDLDTKIIGKNLHYLKTIDSTNFYAKKLLEVGAEEGTIVVSDIQTKGRGRKDRSWSSPSGGLWFSIVLYPDIPPQNAMNVTMTASISIAQGIEKTTGLQPEIKWPNDLLIKNKKVCGILTELDAEMDKINYAIIGIGINVNNEINKNLVNIATSIFDEIGENVSRVALLKSILESFDENYCKFKHNDFDFIKKTWFSYSKIFGKKVQLKCEGSTVEGVVENIDESGCLILKTAEGSVRIVTGDLSIL